MEIITNNVNKTEALGFELAKSLHSGDIVAFYGDLGAGKTSFIRGLAKGLGYTGEVTSPTYTIMHQYKTNGLSLNHFDMYRVLDMESLLSTGFFDFFDEENNITAIEWAENIAFALPKNAIKISLLYSETDNERIIKIE